MINCNKIKARIVELGYTQEDVAKAWNVTPSTANLKINGRRSMSVEEAETLCDFLKIDTSQFSAYFFTTKIAQSNPPKKTGRRGD